MAAIVFIIVWSRVPPVIIQTSMAIPEAVDPGAMVEIERNVKRTRPDCGGGLVAAQVVDSHKQVRTLEPGARTLSSPETGIVIARWLVPEQMPSGQTVYRSTIGYPCFPFYSLWPVTVVYPEVVFWVRAGGHTERQKFGGAAALD